MKPPISARLTPGHPLARSVVGCWPLREGSGLRVFDLSCYRNAGTLYGGVTWQPGKLGICLGFDEADDYISIPSSSGLDLPDDSWSIWLWYYLSDNSGTLYQYILSHGGWLATPSINLFICESGQAGLADKWKVGLVDDDGTQVEVVGDTAIGADSKWHLLGVQRDKAAGQIQLWLDTVKDGFAADTDFAAVDRSDALEIGRRSDGNAGRYYGGLILYALKCERALAKSEIVRLYREPFCMFEPVISCGLLTPEITLSGKIDAATTLSGILALRCHGEWFKGLLEIEAKWLIGALFGGMTANAFKLGTVLSLGWFWMRRSGCSALYRGPSMSQIDFANVLAVAAQDAGSISPPVYVPHDGGSTYFYVIRRFNNCGYQERTLAAAVKVSMDAEGGLVEPQPNNVFASRARQVDSNKVRLTWYYCPLEQESEPACFKVYYDSGTGQIDYENAITTVNYEGRKFYSYQSNALDAARYLFAIRTEDAAGIENGSLAELGIQLRTTSPDAISILCAEAV